MRQNNNILYVIIPITLMVILGSFFCYLDAVIIKRSFTPLINDQNTVTNYAKTGPNNKQLFSCKDPNIGNVQIDFNSDITMFNQIKKRRNTFPVDQVSKLPLIDQYAIVYGELLQNNQKALAPFFKSLKDSLKFKKCTQTDVSRIVVQLVQNIPYRFIHYNSCQYWINQYDHITPCESYAKPLGVIGPYEVCVNEYGDCDSKALLAYQLLKWFNIPANIWWSDVYHHAIIGIAYIDVQDLSAKYKIVNSKYYYTADLTTNDPIGKLKPNYANLDNWKIIL